MDFLIRILFASAYLQVKLHLSYMFPFVIKTVLLRKGVGWYYIYTADGTKYKR